MEKIYNARCCHDRKPYCYQFVTLLDTMWQVYTSPIGDSLDAYSVIWKSIVQTIENRPCMAIALLKFFPFLLIEQALYIA